MTIRDIKLIWKLSCPLPNLKSLCPEPAKPLAFFVAQPVETFFHPVCLHFAGAVTKNKLKWLQSVQRVFFRGSREKGQRAFLQGHISAQLNSLPPLKTQKGIRTRSNVAFSGAKNAWLSKLLFSPKIHFYLLWRAHLCKYFGQKDFPLRVCSCHEWGIDSSRRSH